MIRVEAIWLAVNPLDMRAGTETALARVVAVFGAARPCHAYCSPIGGPTASRYWYMTASACDWKHDD